MVDFDCARFAAISDIHGNVDALAAVLADIAAQGICNVVNLGDHFSGPLAARETADMLLAHAAVSIRGNHDRWLVEQTIEEMGPSDRVAREQLSDEHMEWLRGLPAHKLLDDSILLCHGTPISDTTYWLEAVSPSGQVHLKDLREIAEDAGHTEASLILCGHTHLPRRIDLPDGRTIVNPGSVGCPGYDDTLPVYHVMQTGSTAACYAILERRGTAWTSTFRQIPYDTSRMAALAQRAGRKEWANALRTGWVR